MSCAIAMMHRSSWCEMACVAGAASITYQPGASLKGMHRSSLMPQRAAAKAAAAAASAAPAGPSLSAVSTASTHPGQSNQSGTHGMQPAHGMAPTQSGSMGLQPTQGVLSGLQSQASLGSQAGGQSSPMEIISAASSEAPKRGGNPAANMPALQAGRLGLGLGLKPAATTGMLTYPSLEGFHLNEIKSGIPSATSSLLIGSQRYLQPIEQNQL